jgi:hypothetical protein
MPKSLVSLRVNVPLGLYERIGEYRHAARHESKNQALLTLLAAGLAALAKPPALPKNGLSENPFSPPAEKKLVAFAGAEGNGRAHRP